MHSQIMLWAELAETSEGPVSNWGRCPGSWSISKRLGVTHCSHQELRASCGLGAGPSSPVLALFPLSRFFLFVILGVEIVPALQSGSVQAGEIHTCIS